MPHAKKLENGAALVGMMCRTAMYGTFVNEHTHAEFKLLLWDGRTYAVHKWLIRVDLKYF